MVNPNQIDFFDTIHPKQANIAIRENHAPMRLSDIIPWRDLIAHNAPARYLCNLMDSTWTPDHITIFEFIQMMGAEGMECLNKQILIKATKLGLLEPSMLMADTTAQEAKIPCPNEVGLMKRFSDLALKALKKVGGKFISIKSKAKEIATKAKFLARNSHLFAKTKE